MTQYDSSASDRKWRVVIENVRPSVDCGYFPAKRILGEKIEVTADVFADGHNAVAARLLYSSPASPNWTEVRMEFVVYDTWRAAFIAGRLGIYRFTVEGWIDRFTTWQNDFRKKHEAGQDVSMDILIGAGIIEEAVRRASGEDAKQLAALAGLFRSGSDIDRAVSSALSPEAGALIQRYPDLDHAVRFEKELEVVVDRPKARFSTWYECFPRSASPESGRHGAFADLERLLPEISAMGFDVLYLPPIHPIGKTNRKGKNNSPAAEFGDPGSPWAIGAEGGGHKAIAPELGTMEDFKKLVARASDLGMEIALDIAFQCSPDHPYVKQHPEWFKIRPDGSVQYAENPPKKYEDIFPLNFEAEDRQNLWDELKSVIAFWIDQGVRIFRVDNPHTKPFDFWQWLLAEIKRVNPEIIFLSEAFTRPKVMKRLAKIGFTQSYTYFTWRNTKAELTDYINELTKTEMKEYFRPSFWPNTPDILPEYMQYGGRNAFVVKLILAATLSSNYGIYGPAFELIENAALPGREEYLNSEKFEVRYWDRDRPGNLKEFITRLNRIRRENPALHETANLQFYEIDNDSILFFIKHGSNANDSLLVVVNLDPVNTQSGWIRIPLAELGIDPATPFLGHDLLGEEKFIWYGERNFVQLNPHVLPAQIFKLRKRIRRETDFDYFL